MNVANKIVRRFGLARRVRRRAGPLTECSSFASRLASPQARAAQYLEGSEGSKALEGITTLVLDCDGVIWRGNQVIEGVADALQSLRARGVRLLFVTNNSSKSRKECAAVRHQ